ncbi:MAG: nitrite/sulfite reductase [Aquificae bacterium]|nr:nitrite/sulfite reductase [Aquificota bacterium]
MGKKNRIELLKEELHPFDPEFRRRLERYLKEGDWKKVPEDDLERLKWYGIFYRKAVPGTFMVRIRVPGGVLTARQAKKVAELARLYGGGSVEITSRQQFQIRHLELKDLGAVLEGLKEVGLTTLQTGGDNPRNVVQDPLAGLVEESKVDTTPLTAALTAAVLGKKEYADLPRKLNPAVLGSVRDPVNALYNDFALVLAEGEGGLGFNLYLGGKVGSGGPVTGFDLNAFVPARREEVVDLFLAVLRLYSRLGNRENRNKNRLYFLVRDLGPDRFRELLEEELGRPLRPKGWELVEAFGEREGIIPLSGRGRGLFKRRLYAVLAAVPAGKLPAADLEGFARLAETYGDGRLRLTVYQNLYLVGIPEERLSSLLSEEPLSGYERWSRNSFLVHLVACAGRGTCHFGVIENKEDAVRVARHLAVKLIPSAMAGRFVKEKGLEPDYRELELLRERFSLGRPLRMHWSACAKGCGSHGAADLGFVGTKLRVGGEVVEGVEVFLGGTPRSEGKPVGKVPLKGLERRLEDLLWFFFENRLPGEDFTAFVRRVGVEVLRRFFT